MRPLHQNAKRRERECLLRQKKLQTDFTGRLKLSFKVFTEHTSLHKVYK